VVDDIGRGLTIAGGVGGVLGKGAKLARKLKAGKSKLCLLCFEAGTAVQTDEGLKPIEEIETADRVLS
jgi:hypothetical protein